MNGNLVSVKEYAASRGMTEQAVYKQIRAGKLKTIDREENNKTKKYICLNPEIDNLGRQKDAAAQGLKEETQKPAADPEPARPQKKDIAPTEDKTAAALEKAVEALTAQLAEKDRQIEKLTELLYNSQQLQAHSQMLLAQETPQPSPAPDPQPPEPEPAEEPEPPKKRGFWSWLFN